MSDGSVWVGTPSQQVALADRQPSTCTKEAPKEESSQATAIPAGEGQVCVQGATGVRPIRIQR